MGRKRKPDPHEPSPPTEPKAVFKSPFKDLEKLLKGRAPTPPPIANPLPTLLPAAAKTSAPPALDDATLLQQALAGVRRLDGVASDRIAIEPRVTRTIVSEDAEVLAQLSDLVSGQAPFELTETDEYVEGARLGLDPRVVSQLRRGDFATQGHLDLHGLIQPEAKVVLTDFIVESVRKGRRAVLVVHGRGLRSPGGQPVLKHAVAQWLSHGTIGGYVLAFTSARAYDGGAGAVWVLLRRERKRGKFDILQGAKRRD
ncbi:MAG TPA: Smr/MutS family protein [Candidatus Binataceae bacterium]|nr:Smr/MutS family protein [Candidatus Binataceae bacterium]